MPFFKIGTFGGEPDAFISNELFEKYQELYSFPKVGDILISAAGTIGRTTVYQGERAYFQDSNIVWLDHDDRLVIIAAEMLRRSRLRCYGVPRCAATR